MYSRDTGRGNSREGGRPPPLFNGSTGPAPETRSGARRETSAPGQTLARGGGAEGSGGEWRGGRAERGRRLPVTLHANPAGEQAAEQRFLAAARACLARGAALLLVVDALADDERARLEAAVAALHREVAPPLQSPLPLLPPPRRA